MTRLAIPLTCSLALLLGSSPPIPAADGGGAGYAWSISASATDAADNTPPPLVGIVPIYLWFHGTCFLPDVPGAAVDVLSAEFELVVDGLEILTVIGQNGFVATMAGSTVTLDTGGICLPSGPESVVAATIMVVGEGMLPQTVCLGPSGNGLNATRACDGICHEHNWSGLSAGGGPVCEFRDPDGWGPPCPPGPGRARREAFWPPVAVVRGNPCTPVAVGESGRTGSWGRIKTYYR